MKDLMLNEIKEGNEVIEELRERLTWKIYC